MFVSLGTCGTCVHIMLQYVYYVFLVTASLHLKCFLFDKTESRMNSCNDDSDTNDTGEDDDDSDNESDDDNNSK